MAVFSVQKRSGERNKRPWIARSLGAAPAWAGEANFSETSVEVSEQSQSVVVWVDDNSCCVPGETVDYHTVDGTAVAGRNYQAKSGTLVFFGGTLPPSQAISVNIIDDGVDEDDRTFSVVLSNAVGVNHTIGRGEVVVTILESPRADSVAAVNPAASASQPDAAGAGVSVADGGGASSPTPQATGDTTNPVLAAAAPDAPALPSPGFAIAIPVAGPSPVVAASVRHPHADPRANGWWVVAGALAAVAVAFGSAVVVKRRRWSATRV